MSTTQITLPQLPQLDDPGANAPWNDRARYAEWQLAVLRFEQAERSIAASNRLAEAQEAVAEVSGRHVQAMERLLQDGPGTDTTMNARLEGIEQAIRSLPAAAPAAPSSEDALTAGGVAIVKGVLDAVRTAQG